MGKKSKSKKLRQKQNRTQGSPVKKVEALETSPLLTQATPKSSTPVGLETSETYVRSDIKRILILLSISAIILIGLVLADSKTLHIYDAGQWLARFLKLQ